MMKRAVAAMPKLLVFAVSFASLVCEAAAPVDTSKSGSYDKGSWAFIHTILTVMPASSLVQTSVWSSLSPCSYSSL
jgi:hypothetical protein